MKKIMLVVAMLMMLAGPVFAGAVCTEFTGTLPYVVCGSGFWTGVAVMNQEEVPGCLRIRYSNTDTWKCYKIKAHGVTAFILECEGSNYAELRATLPVTVVEVISNNVLGFSYTEELEVCEEE